MVSHKNMPFKTCLLMCVFFALIKHIFAYQKCNLENDSITILSTSNGRIKGACFNVSISNGDNWTEYRSVLRWLSIPYALPPVDKMRFISPKPANSWNRDILDGTKHPNDCKPAPDFSNLTPFNSSEDCLYLNIYAPYEAYKNSMTERNSSKLLPIYVFIHGGAFVTYSGSVYDGSSLAVLSNMIVITLNYRLGPFGFFYIKGTEAKGNIEFILKRSSFINLKSI